MNKTQLQTVIKELNLALESLDNDIAIYQSVDVYGASQLISTHVASVSIEEGLLDVWYNPLTEKVTVEFSED